MIAPNGWNSPWPLGQGDDVIADEDYSSQGFNRGHQRRTLAL